MKIAACLICKNSAPTIERALSSIRPFVHEINVYDTGSTDGTVALLRRLGKQRVAWVDTRTGEIGPKVPKKKRPEGLEELPLAPIRVKQGEWRNDFSWARTQSFAMASDDCDWLFWMDDDDFIQGAAHLPMLAATAHAAVDGFVMFYDYARDEFGNNVCQLWRERLLRRHPQGQWVEPVHEVWLPFGLGGPPPTYTVVPPQTVSFIHERPTNERYAPTRNLDILFEHAKDAELRGERPTPRTTCYIGTELLTQRRFPEAIDWLQRYLDHPESQVGDERSQAYHKLALALRETGQVDAALEVEFQALRERDDWAENAAGLAESFFAKSDYARTMTWAKRALDLGMPQSMLILNPFELQFLPTVRMAQSCGALERFDEARAWLQRAFALRPGDTMLQEIARGVEASASTAEIVRAVLKLREVLIRHDENAKAWALMSEAIPYVVDEHPLITSARAMTRENVMHMLKPEEYLRWYEDEPKESTVEDEFVEVLGEQIERAGFTLEMAEKFEAEHGRKPRILDLGCNDAWLACFLWKRGGFVADGIELNKASVEKGLKRLERFGAPGTIIQGDIHLAAELLGSSVNKMDGRPSERVLLEPYDIVTCYEVFEHVPDTDKLLSVMESVLSPEGIACVTTPAGAYERGNLEFWHLVERKGHLRAVTPTELAGQIVERGWVEEFRVHQNDSLSWVAWRPFTRKKRVHLVAPGAWEPWSVQDIRTRGIGGSETALAYLGTRLSQRGHDVRVFTDAVPGLQSQSVWRSFSAFDPSEEADAIIVSRSPMTFALELHAPVKALWCHDNTYEMLSDERLCERLTDVVTLSHWQRSRFMRLYPHLEEKLRIVRNGIALTEFDSDMSRFPNADRPFAERKPVAIYSSSADRGLDVLLSLWPQIRAQVPDAELHVFYGWDVFDAVARVNPQLLAYKAEIMRLVEEAGSEDGGVFFKGRVGQDALYQAMQEARVWSYPTAFLETSCISAMEARAAGLPIVTSELGALAETVGNNGYLIPWAADESIQHNRTETYTNVFVRRVVRMLSDEEEWTRWSKLGREGVESLDWERRIDDWERLISGEGA